MIRRLMLLFALCLAACAEPPEPGARVLMMGDSLFAVNRLAGEDVGDALEARLGQPVTNRAALGARFLGGIPGQFVSGDWDWIVLNGGGNDILFSCGCGDCRAMLARLISEDGRQGAIPAEVARLRASGARVALVGYLRSNGFRSPVEHCGPTGDALERRLARLAARDRGVVFVPLADLVPEGDESYMSPDRMHPSPKGGRAIAARIAAAIGAAP
ncbi:MAG: SGNH/GDSL hydrolase family protein [Paenirhodobacter sp.]|uniref:SGNH/GDSL hydrolase family protein n=1 Tax=Paenirhodobacter sp. TaxID=1965326 RepID=UPI003D0C033F